MQSALTFFAISTAIGTASVAVNNSPTATFNDGYYLFLNGTSLDPLTKGKPLSATDTVIADKQKSTQMINSDGFSRARQEQTPNFGAWVASALSRIESLKTTVLDEVEPNDRANASRSIRDAETVLLKLATAGLQKRPSIGWDSSGTVSFYVAVGELSADFTAHGDGKFSFSAKKAHQPSISDELDVGDPLPKALASLFA